MKKIEAFEIVRHGIENSQYFQGCGTSYTEFTDCVTGIGDTEADALEDALESLAQGGWDVEAMEALPEFKAEAEDMSTEQVHAEESAGDAGMDENELYWHVSIRVR